MSTMTAPHGPNQNPKHSPGPPWTPVNTAAPPSKTSTSPALSITPSTAISTALAMCYDRDYSQLTVVSPSTRALLGYLSVPRLRALLQAGTVADTDTVDRAMRRFDRSRGAKAYVVITPSTGLEVLEDFLRREEFAVVTDAERRWVLGVATRGDLEEFVKRRPG